MLRRQFCPCLPVRCVLTSWLVLIVGGACGAAEAEPPPLRIVYFVPTDRQPAAEYQPRLDRVMTEVQRFFREGMEAAGYGPNTFGLERDDDGKMLIHLVRGEHPMATYGRNASGAVRREVKAAMAERGIDVDRETIVIFQLLLRWDGDKAVEVGPYCGGGSHLGGTAWVYDDDRLDPKLLGSMEPGARGIPAVCGHGVLAADEVDQHLAVVVALQPERVRPVAGGFHPLAKEPLHLGHHAIEPRLVFGRRLAIGRHEVDDP